MFDYRFAWLYLSIYSELFIFARGLLYLTISAFKDRKVLDGGKIWTQETDDAVISAWMTESYGRDLPWYRAVGLNEQKSSKHDSSIHPDYIPEHRAAGKTPQFYPCAFPARTQQACPWWTFRLSRIRNTFCFETQISHSINRISRCWFMVSW